MISFETTHSWVAGVTISVAAAPATFTATKKAAVGIMIEFAAWLNAGARPWFGARTFDWRAIRDAKSRITFQLFANGNFSIDAVSGTWTARMGFVVGGPFATITGAAATGTAAPLQFRLDSADRAPSDRADTSGLGAVFRDAPATAAIKPRIEMIETTIDHVSREITLNTASNPRAAWLSDPVYDYATHTASSTGWNRYQIGKITPSRKAGHRWQTAVEAAR